MPPHGWQPPPPGVADVPPPPYSWDVSPKKGRSSLLTIIGVSAAVLLSAAALIVSLTGRSTQTQAAPPISPEPTASGQTGSADKALCEAIAPLMMQSNQDASEWVNLGEQGTPARDAALPTFVEETKDWARQAQEALDQAPQASQFLRRSLQRYIDDLSLYALNVRPGPKQVYDSAAWTDSLVAYGGPKAICGDLGIEW